MLRLINKIAKFLKLIHYISRKTIGGHNMSSVKCVGLVAAAGAAVAGGVSAYKGIQARKRIIADAQRIADGNGGKIPTGGMTKDGKMVDGFTTVDAVKKNTKKGIILGTAVTALVAAVGTAAASALTLLAKAHIK